MNQDKCKIKFVAKDAFDSDDRCRGCAAHSEGTIAADTCTALGPCSKNYREDGRNIIWVIKPKTE